MSSSTWILIYIPIFILLFVILPQQQQRAILLKKRKRRWAIVMTNELIKKYMGKNCIISTGSFGTSVIGKILDINENWIEVETKKGNELINAEYIQSIKIDGKQ